MPHNNALKGTRREASSCFAGIPAARPLARALGVTSEAGVEIHARVLLDDEVTR